MFTLGITSFNKFIAYLYGVEKGMTIRKSKKNDGQYKTSFLTTNAINEKEKDKTIKRNTWKSLAIQRLSLIRRKRRIAEIREREIIIIQKIGMIQMNNYPKRKYDIFTPQQIEEIINNSKTKKKF